MWVWCWWVHARVYCAFVDGRMAASGMRPSIPHRCTRRHTGPTTASVRVCIPCIRVYLCGCVRLLMRTRASMRVGVFVHFKVQGWHSGRDGHVCVCVIETAAGPWGGSPVGVRGQTVSHMTFAGDGTDEGFCGWPRHTKWQVATQAARHSNAKSQCLRGPVVEACFMKPPMTVCCSLVDMSVDSSVCIACSFLLPPRRMKLVCTSTSNVPQMLSRRD
mmetsp:Transcript_44630/g.75111  ORF Transcript_44630/g.75111 Transcript_44630/m.75111 type:complete len:217 (-) Transcript_44630:63-713(-)